MVRHGGAQRRQGIGGARRSALEAAAAGEPAPAVRRGGLPPPTTRIAKEKGGEFCSPPFFATRLLLSYSITIVRSVRPRPCASSFAVLACAAVRKGPIRT